MAVRLRNVYYVNQDSRTLLSKRGSPYLNYSELQGT